MNRSVVLYALLSLPVAVLAQSVDPAVGPRHGSAPPVSAPGQPATLARQDAEMKLAALKVAQMIDAGQSAALWDGASTVAKKAVTRELFVSQIGAERGRLGSMVARGTATITRVKHATGAQVPEGLYVNVSLPTRFANVTQPVRELISFRLDEDQIWRLSGYHLRVAD